MNNLVTKRLQLIPFKQELVQAALRGDDELAKVLGIDAPTDKSGDSHFIGTSSVVDLDRPLP